MGQISAHLNPRSNGELPNDTLVNPKNNNAHCIAIVTRNGKAVGSDARRDDDMIKNKGKAKVTSEKEIPEEVHDDDSNLKEAEIQGKNPMKDKDSSVEDEATPTNLKSLPKLSPPFPQTLKKRKRI